MDAVLRRFYEGEFTTFDIIKKFGLKRERLKDWMERGYIEPSVQKARGVGTKNLFNTWDLYMIKLFQHLTSRGFPREFVSIRINILKSLRDDGILGSKIEYFNFIVLTNMPRSKPRSSEFYNKLHSRPDEYTGIIYNTEGGDLAILRSLEYISDILDHPYWEDVIIVNFKNIRGFVDNAIK